MYSEIDSRSAVLYREKFDIWKEFMNDLNPECIQYLEIGSLHGSSILSFHNMFGPNVHSTSIDPFSNCDHYYEYEDEHEMNY
jgi:hypothetical protein